MADSVLFDGVDDRIVLSKGAVVGGAVTLAVVCKYVSTTPDLQALVSHDSASARLGAWAGGTLWVNWDGSGDEDNAAGGSAPLDAWRLVVYTRSTGQGRYHYYNGSTWTHADGSAATQANWSISSTMVLGRSGAGLEEWNGNILIFGWLNADTSDGGVEMLADGYQAWIDFGFAEGVRLDATSGLSTFVSGGTMSENSRTGTTLDTGDVPSWWDDSLGGPPPAPDGQYEPVKMEGGSMRYG